MTPDFTNRYHRQSLLPQVGDAGQAGLGGAHALVVGCGALGCVSSELLVRAGVGRVTIVDRDVVEPTNLQRQCLFDERDVAESLPKAAAAERRLRAVNSAVAVRGVVADFTAETASAFFRGGGCPGVIVDGTDNFETRYLLNDLAVAHGVPYCYAGVIGTHGLTATILPRVTACLRCLFPDPPAPGSTPTCETAGVFGPAVCAAAARQASDAVKVLMGSVDTVGRALVEIDLWTGVQRSVAIPPFDPGGSCVCCVRGRFEYASGRGAGAARLCGSGAVQVASAGPVGGGGIDLPRLARRLDPHGRVTVNPYLLRADLPAHGAEMTVFKDGRVIVRGVRGVAEARSLYARYVGS